MAKCVLLEPIMKVVITTPNEYVGEVTSDINKRRGHVEEVSTLVGSQVMRAKVPLAEMFGYVTILRSITSGRASWNMEFSHYSEVPKELVDEVLYKIRGYVS